MSRPHDERGAVLPIVAVFMTVMILITGLALDLGRQRVARTDMQSLTDVVSLDLARQLQSGQTASVLLNSASFRQAIVDSVARNSSTTGASPTIRVEVGDFAKNVFTVDGGLNYQAPGLVASITSSGLPLGSDVPDSVRVTAGTTVSFAFVPGAGGANRSSVASQLQPSVCLSVGTRALALDTTTGLLSPLLDYILRVNLSAVGYSGIVDAQSAYIPAAGLLASLNIGSVSEAASASVTLGRLMVATAGLLQANGNTALANVLNAVTLGVPGTSFALGSILNLSTATSTAGLDASLNVLDLLSAAIVAANGSNAIALNIPNVTNITVIEPPRIACGGVGTAASSGQIRVNVATTVATSALPLVGSTLSQITSTSIGLNLPIDIGAGTATVTALGCTPDSVGLNIVTGVVNAPPAGQTSSIQLTVKNSALTDLLTATIDPLGLIKAAFNLLGLSGVDLKASVSANVGSSAYTKNVTYPAAPDLPAKIVVPPSGTGQLINLTGSNVTITSTGVIGLLGAVLSTVLNGLLTTIVMPVVNGLSTYVLTPVVNAISALLGIKLGVAEVNLLDRPVCQGVELAQ